MKCIIFSIAKNIIRYGRGVLATTANIMRRKRETMGMNVNCKDCEKHIETLCLSDGVWQVTHYCIYCGHPIKDIDNNIDCFYYEPKYPKN